MVDCLKEQGIVPGIKVDKGLVPLANSNGESWCMGLDGLDARCAEYYKAGARFAKWRSVVSIPAGPSIIAQRDCAYGLARYAAIAQNAGLVPIVEPEVLLDGEHDIDRCARSSGEGAPMGGRVRGTRALLSPRRGRARVLREHGWLAGWLGSHGWDGRGAGILSPLLRPFLV